MTITIKAPGLEGQTFEARLIIGGVPQPTVTITNYGNTPEAVEMTALAQRVTVLDGEITNPSAGRTVVRDDGTTLLDLTGIAEAQTITGEMPNGAQAIIVVPAAAQKHGHGNGVHYKLPLDANNRFICEPGQRHRKWYYSKSGAALTRAQIATAAGVSEATVTGAWLLTRPQYGGSAETAIHADLFSIVRAGLTADNQPTRSDWYFLECGYEYSWDWGGFSGEDELHPMRIASFGSGAEPVVRLFNNYLMLPFCVTQDVRVSYDSKGNYWRNWCHAFDHVTFTREHVFSQSSLNTMHECLSLTAWYSVPNSTETWPAGTPLAGTPRWTPQGGNYTSCIYGGMSEGLLIEGNLFDHAGWGEGYDYNGAVNAPQPPTMFSHNIYLSESCRDLTIRHNFLSRASSCGVQLRGGVHLEGNMLIDNNIAAAVNSFSGVNQFNNVLDNVAVSSGYKRVAYAEGGYDWGYDVNGPLSAMKGNVIAHRANPDDPAEVAAKPGTNWLYGVSTSAKLADDTQSWKWSSQNRGVEGIPAATLDQTTIQRRAGTRLGKASGTIDEYVDYVAAQPSYRTVVREDVRWFKEWFGKPLSTRTAPADLVFEPDVDFEGFRWDNRYNWSTGDLPGRNVADTVDLAGNRVLFGTVEANIAALKSGGGMLDVTSGKLTIGTLTDAASLILRVAGQAWIGGSIHPLSVMSTSGRLALTGETADLDLHAGGHAQALLGPDCTVPAGRSLILSGQQVRVGWDGTGTATLDIAGKLEFRRGIMVSANPGNPELIRHVYRHIGKTVTGSVSGFTGRVAAVERTTVRGIKFDIWLDEVVGTPVAGDVFNVAPTWAADGNDTPNPVTIVTVGATGVAPLQRIRSGAVGDGLVEPTVTATVNLAPTAQIVVPAGLPAGTYDLTGPGVTVVNNGASLPAGVTVTGGKLVLTVS